MNPVIRTLENPMQSRSQGIGTVDAFSSEISAGFGEASFFKGFWRAFSCNIMWGLISSLSIFYPGTEIFCDSAPRTLYSRCVTLLFEEYVSSEKR